MKKQPEQTAHTKQAIVNAFWDLAVQQGLDKVTVSAITKRAGFNRGTFYVYFNDMEDLRIQEEEDMILDLQSRMKSALYEGSVVNCEIASKKVVEALTLYDDKLFLLIGRNGDPDFLARVMEMLSSVLYEFFDKADENPYSGYITAYMSSAVIGSLIYWHDTGRKISIEELSEVIYGLAAKRSDRSWNRGGIMILPVGTTLEEN